MEVATPEEFLQNSPACHCRPAQLTELGSAAGVITEAFYPLDSVLALVQPLLAWGIYLDLKQRETLRQQGKYQCFVAVTVPHPQVIGVVELEFRRLFPQRPVQPRPEAPYLSNLAVAPPYRRRGVAQQLLKTVEAWLVEQEQVSLYLHVLDSNHGAKQLYDQLGYGIKAVDDHWLLPRRLLLHKALA